MTKWDHMDKDGSLCWKEFLAMTKKDPDVLRVLYELGLITKGEMNLEENDYLDVDSDIECEMERRLVERDERIERIKSGIEHTQTTE